MEYMPIPGDSGIEKAINAFKTHYANLSEYNTDMFYDCREILLIQFERFEFYLEYEEREFFRNLINDMKDYNVPPRKGYRFHIVNGLDRLICSVRKITECTVNDIIDFLELCENKPPEIINSVPELVSTVFIFEGNENVYRHDIYASQCSDLVRRFESRNIVLKSWI